MQTVLIVIHLLVVIALIATVLLQRSEGGALGMGGGGGAGSFFTGRGQANALTRATAILATLFFITSLSLTVLASYTRSQKSIFESPAGSTAPAEPGQGSVLDKLKAMQKAPPAPEQAPPAPEPTPGPGTGPDQAPPRSR
ncbi:preprotein translocase subunit SecG [uncultured Rhodoblastus sp.]|uniref:preprotein translocase subunit SecG n=1 Tax=uncultured Rhodoblastus sp. TaxID=543037 RepID=UPI0025CFA8D4|nr:preprotein translocase subunit SecG [uncultured Rhodoblastus sp.]